MHGLHFVPDSLSAADFVLALALEKLPSRLGLIHFYDIDTREFVLVSAVGVVAEGAAQRRTSERDPLIAAAMSRRKAVVVNDPESPLLQNGRWHEAGVVCRSLMCVPVELSGRFLGAIELVNPRDGGLFSESDGYAVTYMGEQLAQYLAEHGVAIDRGKAAIR